MARKVHVVKYNKMWPVMFSKEKEILQRIFLDIQTDIVHFGSTSIVGMSSKPIIDIMIIVDDINMIDNYNESMIMNGYTPRGENGIEGRRYFVKLTCDDSGNHTHHIHIYQRGNCHIEDELMFRNYLTIDSESFLYYERVKIDAAIKFINQPLEYQNAKSICVSRIMAKAKQYYNK